MPDEDAAGSPEVTLPDGLARLQRGLRVLAYFALPAGVVAMAATRLVDYQTLKEGADLEWEQHAYWLGGLAAAFSIVVLAGRRSMELGQRIVMLGLAALILIEMPQGLF